MSEANEVVCHSVKQSNAIQCPKRIMVLSCGTQWGKTIVGALRMKEKTHTYTNETDNFIITAPTYKILHQSTLPWFLKFMDGYGTYNSKFDEFRINGGGTVYCRTETDPDSIVGIPNVKHIWGDEAGKYRLYFWENILARADSCGASIDLTTSPYSMNWIPKELIKPWEKGLRPDLEVISAASWENPYHSLHDEANRDLRRRTMDPRRFDMIYGGQFGKMSGLVYDCFDEDTHTVEAFQLPTGTKFYGGIDWGYNDPFVIKIRAITPSGFHFAISEFCKSRLILDQQIIAAKQKMKIFGVEMFYADPSRPENIEAFNRAGIPTIGADNQIRLGVDTHYELITRGNYKVFKGSSPHTLDEFETYHYPEPEDLGPDDKQKEALPVDQNNHCMDAERYITMGTHMTAKKFTPKTAEPINPRLITDHDKRLKILKSGKKPFHGSEEYS